MKKTIFIILVLIIIAAFYYFYFYRINKKNAIKILLKANPERSESSVSSFDEEFLIAWATAVRRESPDFTYNGKVYVSSTGKAKV